MNSKKIFNLEALVSVKIRDKKQCLDFTWKPAKKGFFFSTEEGFYNDYALSIFTIEELTTGEYPNSSSFIRCPYEDIKFL